VLLPLPLLPLPLLLPPLLLLLLLQAVLPGPGAVRWLLLLPACCRPCWSLVSMNLKPLSRSVVGPPCWWALPAAHGLRRPGGPAVA
jgi:hypothetical protein